MIRRAPITTHTDTLSPDTAVCRSQPISEFFPGFKNMKVLLHPDTSLESRPATRPITVRNLLTHTAGLGYTIVTQGTLLKEYERLGITPGAINAAVEAQARPDRQSVV